MRVTAAVLYDVNKPYSIETVELACFADYAVVPEMGCVPAPAALDFPELR